MCSTYGKGDNQLFLRVSPPSLMMKMTEAMIKTRSVIR